jgi:hypothetical protein
MPFSFSKVFCDGNIQISEGKNKYIFVHNYFFIFILIPHQNGHSPPTFPALSFPKLPFFGSVPQEVGKDPATNVFLLPTEPDIR